MRDLWCLECLQGLHNSIVIAKTACDLGHTDQEGLGPPLHQLVPPEAWLVPVSENLTIRFQLEIALRRLLLWELKRQDKCYISKILNILNHTHTHCTCASLGVQVDTENMYVNTKCPDIQLLANRCRNVHFSCHPCCLLSSTTWHCGIYLLHLIWMLKGSEHGSDWKSLNASYLFSNVILCMCTYTQSNTMVYWKLKGKVASKIQRR